MAMQQTTTSDVRVDVENIGGIERANVDFSPGVTVLEGRNATNRTSFLQAVMAALGSETGNVKGDADEGSVELTIGDETYTRRLHRRGETVVTDGDPYLADPELADLFAFLLESNEARQAVARGDDLRELIMRPVDTDEIEAEIERLASERDDLERQLENIDDLQRKLPELEEERTQLQEKIDDKKAELEEKEAELEAADADVEETREEKAELEEKLDELRAKRSDLDDVRFDLETERESLEQLQRERRELKDEQEDLAETPAGELAEIETRIDQLRERKQVLETEVNELQSVIGFNEEMLDDAGSGTFADLAAEESEAVTDQLLADDEVTCWTCGSEVATDQIEATIDELRSLSQSKIGEINDLGDEIDELNAERRELEQVQQERDRIERRLDELARQIETTEETIEELQARRSELTEEIETVEEEVEALEDEEYSAILDLHREANQLEYELGKLETDLERVEDEIGSIESTIDERSELEAELEAVKSRIEDCRTKIERIEETAVEEFNEHMDTVLDLLDYANLDRIWLERRETEVRQGRRNVDKRVFELHVVRTTASGAAYEDTVEHLSESEREVTGLVFALAGYLAHELYEEVPFMLLDSLEAIDSERIATLVDYFTDYTGYLLVALLPEDAAALGDDVPRVTEI